MGSPTARLRNEAGEDAMEARGGVEAAPGSQDFSLPVLSRE